MNKKDEQIKKEVLEECSNNDEREFVCSREEIIDLTIQKMNEKQKSAVEFLKSNLLKKGLIQNNNHPLWKGKLCPCPSCLKNRNIIKEIDKAFKDVSLSKRLEPKQK